VPVGLNIKRLSFILLSAFFVTACQQDDKQAENQPSAKTEQVETKTSESVEVQTPAKVEAAKEVVAESKPVIQKEASHEGHDHSNAESNTTGEKYRVVEPQMECEVPVVYEFFAYHCPHCYNLEPAAEAWRKKNAGKVKFVPVPTHLGNMQMGSLLLVHHAADKLGILEKTQHALFERFHKERKLFASPEEAAEFLVKQGAKLEDATAVLADQAAIEEALKADYEKLRNYKITSVPQILVNHRYMTSITMAGGTKETFEVVDQLLALEHNCKAK